MPHLFVYISLFLFTYWCVKVVKGISSAFALMIFFRVRKILKQIYTKKEKKIWSFSALGLGVWVCSCLDIYICINCIKTIFPLVFTQDRIPYWWREWMKASIVLSVTQKSWPNLHYSSLTGLQGLSQRTGWIMEKTLDCKSFLLLLTSCNRIFHL